MTKPQLLSPGELVLNAQQQRELGALISADYLREQQILHAAPRGYGQRGRKWADTVLTLTQEFHCATVLDYGCGTGSLGQALRVSGLQVREYDPAFRDKAALPEPADLVVCTDVLEHIEPDKLDAVLTHLRSLTQRVLFVVISVVPTAKYLTNGEQAHICLHPAEWWREVLTAHGWTIERELNVKPEKQWVAVLTC